MKLSIRLQVAIYDLKGLRVCEYWSPYRESGTQEAFYKQVGLNNPPEY
jgi:hypothetical protein